MFFAPEKIDSFKCHYCDETFSKDAQRTDHIESQHPNMPFKCFVCPKEKEKKSDYVRHRDVQQKGAPNWTLFT